MKGYEYQPLIFGMLCEGLCKVDGKLARMLSDAVGDSALLPFSVETRHLKNVFLTMKLMDIVGLVIEGDHRKAILKYLPKAQHSARASRYADVVVRKGKSFKGFDSLGLALEEWLEEIGIRRGRTILAGTHPIMDEVKGTLNKLGFKVKALRGTKPPKNTDVLIIGELTPSQTRRIASLVKGMSVKPAVVDLRKGGKPLARSPRLTIPQLQKRTRNVRVELLTSGVNNN